MTREWNARTVYLYLVSFVTLMMMIFGTVNLVLSVVDIFVPPPIYSPGPYEFAPEGTKLTPEEQQARAIKEEERNRQNQAREQWRRFAQAVALLMVAAPVYRYHWRRIQEGQNGMAKKE